MVVSSHGGCDRQGAPRAVLWLISMTLAALAVAGGCTWARPGGPAAPRPGPGDEPGSPGDGGDPLPAGGCGPGQCDAPANTSALIDCPTGSCDPGDPNGLGLYVVEGGRYCLPGPAGESSFCPEAFVNTPEGVSLELREVVNPFQVRVAPLIAFYKETLTAIPARVTLRRFTAERGELAISYVLDGHEYVAMGNNLAKLELQASVPGWGSYYTVRVSTHSKSASGLSRYQLEYSLNEENRYSYSFFWHCQVPRLPAAQEDASVVYFLSQQRISGTSGYARRDVNVITMACETGAIATCMNWGYTPWDPATGRLDNNRDHLFRSCLQAKRAAYFVGQGDLRSYTATGTAIALRDQYGIRDAGIARLEAIWSPEGAVCLNPENVRNPDAFHERPPTSSVGACAPPQWSERGKLATGRLSPPW